MAKKIFKKNVNGIIILTDMETFVKVKIPSKMLVKRYINGGFAIINASQCEYYTATAVVHNGDIFDYYKGVDIATNKIYRKFVKQTMKAASYLFDKMTTNIMDITILLNNIESKELEDRLVAYVSKKDIRLNNYFKAIMETIDSIKEM